MEGVVKFQCIFSESEPPPESVISDLNKWRQRLWELGFIGEYPDGIGYGNVSIRYNDGFIITGTQTGGKAKLKNDDYSIVTSYNFDKYEISCMGKSKASSESLTHAAVYQTCPEINAVFHIHNKLLWKKLLWKYPTTPTEIEYGTSAMAYSIINMLNNNEYKDSGIIIMGGHEDGIIVYGKSADEAGEIIENFESRI